MTIDEIKQLLKEISPWPWHTGQSQSLNFVYSKLNSLCAIGECHYDEKDTDVRFINARFIAQSPQIIADLVEKLEKAKRCLRFYSDEWRYTGNAACPPTFSNRLNGSWDRGQYAQETLKELE